MATSTFDKVFVVNKTSDKERLRKILASNNKLTSNDLISYSADDWKKHEGVLLACLLRLAH